MGIGVNTTVVFPHVHSTGKGVVGLCVSALVGFFRFVIIITLSWRGALWKYVALALYVVAELYFIMEFLYFFVAVCIFRYFRNCLWFRYSNNLFDNSYRGSSRERYSQIWGHLACEFFMQQHMKSFLCPFVCVHHWEALGEKN